VEEGSHCPQDAVFDCRVHADQVVAGLDDGEVEAVGRNAAEGQRGSAGVEAQKAVVPVDGSDYRQQRPRRGLAVGLEVVEREHREMFGQPGDRPCDEVHEERSGAVAVLPTRLIHIK
jgi:hypothetical protein